MVEHPDKTADTTVYGVTGGKRILLWLLGAFYLCWARTIRLRIDDESREAASYQAEPLIIIMWHNTLFMAPIAHKHLRDSRRVYGLISASRDGGELAYFFKRVGIGAVRGSSSRFGREAFKDIIRCHREGHDVTITPDGPRGPVYVMKAGAVLAARRVRSRVLLAGVAYDRCWRLKSWDRFFLPVPFSTVTMRCVLVTNDEIPSGQAGIESLQSRMRAVTGDPDLEELAGASITQEKDPVAR
jgi:lysophospholipid acyltransferase (LPLAT)-like uncharacterized protein